MTRKEISIIFFGNLLLMAIVFTLDVVFPENAITIFLSAIMGIIVGFSVTKLLGWI